ncbi:MAG: tRNA (adenosine(37)-N6)-threonylcarbamoyltransferase complex dimerization subunit type 1 TsaB [Bacteroidales bacterium]|jgi:tRNA threonylcarbamoyladenosine biosynthesis protein TsaB|nr:tRNA (adenosine(37)-N6)-threonylcarbamoyltransferase complex dimerization subunit type 1 TsaB [Bacteroidales bacterium]
MTENENPHLLMVETATEVCSVAVSRGKHVVSYREISPSRDHAQLLVPYIEATLSDAGLICNDLQGIAISTGPGSYTGLRIGISAVKGLCYALDIPFIAIPTLQNIASGTMISLPACPAADTLIVPLLDARRMEVYTALFDTNLDMIGEVQDIIVDNNSFHDLLSSREVIFCGNGVEKCKELLSCYPNARFNDTHLSARWMLKPALKAFQLQMFEDLAYFEPFYFKEYTAAKSRVKGLL